jgi:hypothetical protein
MAEDPEFDVFLSHNSKDKPRVRKLAERRSRAFEELLVSCGRAAKESPSPSELKPTKRSAQKPTKRSTT